MQAWPHKLLNISTTRQKGGPFEKYSRANRDFLAYPPEAICQCLTILRYQKFDDMKKYQTHRRSGDPSPLKIRLTALIFIPMSLVACGLTLYWLSYDILPLFGRIYRDAPIVETPYLGFFLLMGLPGLLYLIVASALAAWNGKRFDPPQNSKLYRFQSLMLAASIKTAVFVAPALIAITTLTLMWRDYSPCPKLLISGSAWQLFWVNDDKVCFKPEYYINDHWPCKKENGKEICVQADGR